MKTYIRRSVILPIYDGVVNRLADETGPNEKDSDVGLVLNWNFHRNNRYVCAVDPYFVQGLIDAFEPVIISTQRQYDACKESLNYVLSPKPGWAAPMLDYDTQQDHEIGIFVSDPHNSKTWVPEFVAENEIEYVFSYYYHPFLKHMPESVHDKLVHLPWAIPEKFLVDPDAITYQNQDELHLFGASGSEAYDTRDWCRQFHFVRSHENSGVQNPVMSDREYFDWLTEFDAMIAAGSLSEKYQLVTPKYFEIAGAGSLLFAQYCDDLEQLGIDDSNAVIFDKENFKERSQQYLENPEQYLDRRRRGAELIRERHTIADRIETIRETMMT